MDAIWMCCASENTQLCLHSSSNALKLWRKEVSFSYKLEHFELLVTLLGRFLCAGFYCMLQNRIVNVHKCIVLFLWIFTVA